MYIYKKNMLLKNNGINEYFLFSEVQRVNIIIFAPVTTLFHSVEYYICVL